MPEPARPGTGRFTGIALLLLCVYELASGIALTYTLSSPVGRIVFLGQSVVALTWLVWGLAKFIRGVPFDRYGWLAAGMIIFFGTSCSVTQAAYAGMAG